MRCRPDSIFEQMRGARVGLLVIVIALLGVSLSAGAFGDGAQKADEPSSPGASKALPESEFQLTQTLSIGIGTLQGDRAAFLRHEDEAVPSLNPDVELEGRVHLRTWLSPDMHVRLQTSFAGEGKTSFGIGWREWDLAYGAHSFNFAPAGLSYTKSTDGLRLLYQQAGSPAALQLVSARSNARDADVTIRGNDTFGPFFLGQKRIVPESERVEVDGVGQRRGTGPGDGDYYVDYDGGFIYFNRVLLAHETARVTFEYYFDDPALASDFAGALAGYTFGPSTVHAFALRDYTPVEEHSIVERPGSTLLAYGANVQTTLSSGARLANTMIATHLRERYAVTRERTDELTLEAGRTLYTLTRRPVLYESERVVLTYPGEGPVQLVRHLDYTVDYHLGELTFSFDPMDGASAVVVYEYIDGALPEAKPPVRGVQTLNRFDYTGERWRTSAWLDAVEGQFVNVANRKQPPIRLRAGTQTHYTLGSGWGLLGDVAVTGQQESTAVSGALGVDYRRERLETRVQLGRDVNVTDLGTTSLDYVRGGLTWRSAADVEVAFKQQLDTYRGGLPEQLEATVAGRLGRLPFSLGYTHGDKHYEEKVAARLTVPAEGRHTRGVATFGTQWLFADGFGDEPRTVYSVTGDVTYSPPEGMYARGQATVSLTTFGLMGTKGYVVRGDVGRGLGSTGLIDYQLRLNGRQTEWQSGPSAQRQRSDESSNVAHTVTLAGAITDSTNAALAWRQSDGLRWRPDRGRTVTTEQGWQLSLHTDMGPLSTTLSYDTSATNVTAPGSTAGGGSAIGPGGKLRTTVERTRLALDWEREVLSARGTLEYALYDGSRRRRTSRIVPAYELSDNARLWVAYEHIAGDDAGAPGSAPDDETPPGASYEVHMLRVGMTIEF